MDGGGWKSGAGTAGMIVARVAGEEVLGDRSKRIGDGIGAGGSGG